jgi:hypothetical protein
MLIHRSFPQCRPAPSLCQGAKTRVEDLDLGRRTWYDTTRRANMGTGVHELHLPNRLPGNAQPRQPDQLKPVNQDVML